MAIARIEDAYEHGNYSEEKMAEKVSEKNNEIAGIEEQIQKAGGWTCFMSSIDLEAQKLKKASEQVKYRLENLTRNKRKSFVICLWIVWDVRRRKNWNISAEIYFRFNPRKFRTKNRGRTSQAQETKKSHQGSKEGRWWAREDFEPTNKKRSQNLNLACLPVPPLACIRKSTPKNFQRFSQESQPKSQTQCERTLFQSS